MLLIISGKISAQNLVPNGDFETMNACPTNYGQVSDATGWSHILNNWNPAYGTDYLNSCNTSLFGVPSNDFGTQSAHSGNGYVSEASMAPTISNGYRENIYTQMSVPMIVGATYSVSMFVSHADDTQNSSNNFGIKFSTNSSFLVNDLSHVYSSSVISNDNIWTQITNTFVADSSYQYIGVGNFFTDANTTTITTCYGCYHNLFIYFVDDISVSLISLPPPTTVSVNISPCSETAGSATAIVTGTPSSQYSYSWSGSAQTTSIVTGLLPGLQTVTITDLTSLATQSTTFEIGGSAIQLSITNGPSSCTGHSVLLTANASGGSGHYTYAWTNGPSSATYNAISNISGLIIYTVTVLDSIGCSAIGQTSITVAPSPVLSANSNTNSVCLGGTVMLTGSGANNYGWNGGVIDGVPFTPTVTRVYTMTGLNVQTGCTSTSSIIISVNPLPAIFIISNSTVLCSGQSATLTASGAFTYDWTNISNSPSVVVTPTSTSIFTVTGTDSNGCTNTETMSEQVTKCTDLNSIQFEVENLNIFPNPSSGNLTILGSKEMNLILIDELGQKVKFLSLNYENQYRYDILSLNKGLYFLVSKDGQIINKKILVTY